MSKCTRGGVRKRRGGRIHICVREGESLESLRLFSRRSEREWEKCGMLSTNADEASHTPSRRSGPAAGNRGLDMIFSSAVFSACLPLSLISACLESCSPASHTACSWQCCLVMGSASSQFLLLGKVLAKITHAFLIKLTCLITPSKYEGHLKNIHLGCV